VAVCFTQQDSQRLRDTRPPNDHARTTCHLKPPSLTRLAWGGSRSFFSGEGLLLLRCSGHGDLLIASYGAIRCYTLNEGEMMALDTGHVVAFDDTIHYAVRKSGAGSRRCWVGKRW
jgi:hypothetical protein